MHKDEWLRGKHTTRHCFCKQLTFYFPFKYNLLIIFVLALTYVSGPPVAALRRMAGLWLQLS